MTKPDKEQSLYSAFKFESRVELVTTEASSIGTQETIRCLGVPREVPQGRYKVTLERMP